MALPAVIAGAAGMYALYRIFKPEDHDKLVEATHKTLVRQSGSSTKVYTDFHHYQDNSAAGNTRNLDFGDEHIPDHVVQSPPGSKNLVIEVETDDDRLDSEARSQLKDFRSEGYSRVLVVPSKFESEAQSFVRDLDGRVLVATPDSVSDLV